MIFRFKMSKVRTSIYVIIELALCSHIQSIQTNYTLEKVKWRMRAPKIEKDLYKNMHEPKPPSPLCNMKV